MMEYLLSVPHAVWFAIGGAVGYKSLDFIELHKLPRRKWPNFGWLYWLAFLLHPLLGVGLVLVYMSEGQVLGAFLAVNIGITAPAILKNLASQADGPIDTPEDA